MLMARAREHDDGGAASRRWLVPLACAVISAAACGGPSSPEPSERRMGRDWFSAGSDVRLSQPVDGDVVMAGGRVEIAGAVAGDGVVAGGNVDVRAPIMGDLYAAGGDVVMNGTVAGSSRFAGGTVRIGPDSKLAGGVSVVAGEAEIGGALGDYLQLMAGQVRIDGTIAGDVDVVSPALEVGPAARIGGSLTVHGPNAPNLLPGAIVEGEVQHISTVEPSGWGPWASGLLFTALLVVGFGLVGAVLLTFWPGFTRAVSGLPLKRPGRALLIGAALLLGTPVALFLLFISLIGAPLALICSFVYVLLFPLGYMAAALVISDGLLSRWRPGERRVSSRALALVLVLLVLSLVVALPVVGPLLALAATALGAGSIAMVVASRINPSRHGHAHAPFPASGPVSSARLGSPSSG